MKKVERMKKVEKKKEKKVLALTGISFLEILPKMVSSIVVGGSLPTSVMFMWS